MSFILLQEVIVQKYYLCHFNRNYLLVIDTIIIYGHNLQSYCTLEGLLACGVPGNHLVFIENFPLNRTMEKRQKHNVTIFNNPDIDAVVGENIAALGEKDFI